MTCFGAGFTPNILPGICAGLIGLAGSEALESKSVQREMVNILLNCSHLYEDLRARASAM